MPNLACKDMFKSSCPFVAEGETEIEVKRAFLEHAQKEHPQKLKELLVSMSNGELKRKMQSEIEEGESWDVG